MRFIKVILIAILILWFAPVNQSQTTIASYGVTVTSLTTTGTGAVTGTTFAVPTTYAAMITWQVTANGSALSTILEGSNDNSSWATVDTQTTATGGIKNFGFTSLKFIRCSQVSRTGGTSTSCTIVVNRGFITGSSANINRVLADSGTSTAPAYSYVLDSDSGWYRNGDGDHILSLNGNNVLRVLIAGTTLPGLNVLQWGSSGTSTPDLRLGRYSTGLLSIMDASTNNGGYVLGPTLFANLGTPAPTNGTVRFCSDCTIANPCASGGTGALAKRLNGVWVCN